MIVAIDGPTASGKGTIAKAVAEHFDLPCLDTGLLYRGVALTLMNGRHNLNDVAAARAAAMALDLSSHDPETLRTAAVGSGASVVAAIPEVRAALLDYQRNFANQAGGAVLDGRDIATVIAPQADVKIFVTATAEERAKRRQAELEKRGEVVSFETMLAQIQERDARDSGRKDAPLAMAPDAILLDTTTLSIDAAIAEARAVVARARI